MRHVSLSGERGGPACGWWKVESTMLRNRKAKGCYIWPFYKNVPYPPTNRIPLICLCSKGKNAKRFPFWRERGTIRFSEWWKVECCMLEHRKACWCMQYFCFIWRSHVQHPPPCNSCGIAPTMSRRLIFVCWDKGKHENVLSSFILKSERKPSDFWSAVW